MLTSHQNTYAHKTAQEWGILCTREPEIPQGNSLIIHPVLQGTLLGNCIHSQHEQDILMEQFTLDVEQDVMCSTPRCNHTHTQTQGAGRASGAVILTSKWLIAVCEMRLDFQICSCNSYLYLSPSVWLLFSTGGMYTTLYCISGQIRRKRSDVVGSFWGSAQKLNFDVHSKHMVMTMHNSC